MLFDSPSTQLAQQVVDMCQIMHEHFTDTPLFNLSEKHNFFFNNYPDVRLIFLLFFDVVVVVVAVSPLSMVGSRYSYAETKLIRFYFVEDIDLITKRYDSPNGLEAFT